MTAPDWRATAVVVAALTFFASAFLSPNFSGYPPEMFPVPQVRPPVQPAGFAFSIWGVIYLGLIGHAVFGLARRRDVAAWDAPRLALIGTLALGTVWLAIAARSPVLATVVIWAMLVLALVALAQAARTPGEGWIRTTPLALYAGWLTAASFVSIGLLVGGYNLAGSNVNAALVTLVPAIAFAAVVQWRLGVVPGYGAAAGWGLFGIAAANWQTAPSVAYLAIFGILALAATLALAWRRAT